jgi:hypothetical protein
MKQIIRQVSQAILFCLFAFCSHAQSYTLMGAGTAAVNGTYTPIALSLLPDFSSIPVTIIGPAYFLAATNRYLCLFNDEDGFPVWIIGNGSNVEYSQFVASNTTPPPSSGWISDVGVPPGPTVSVVLSVELLAFSVENMKSGNHLTWRTATESQNKGFDIERSTDGVRFQKIGFIAGNGTTTERQDYSFKDDAQSRLVYYRLKQLDFDGNYEYSKIISIAQNGKNEVSVFPNPSNGVFSIAGSEELEDEQFTLINSIGQTLSISIQNDQPLDLSAYPLGVYYLCVASSGQVVRLVKE